jgi:hypothetical protein
MGLSVTVVTDATGVTSYAGMAPGRVNEIAQAILGPFVSLATSEEVIEAEEPIWAGR